MKQVTKQDLVEQLAEAMSAIEYAIWLLNDDDIKNANRFAGYGVKTAAIATQRLKLLAEND